MRCSKIWELSGKDRVIKFLFWFSVIGVLLLAVKTSFIQDDAFISFRYSYNLVHNQELAWNIGERVEGYTNFLWTLIMAVPIALNLEPILSSKIIGLLFFLGTITLTYKLSEIVTKSSLFSLFSIILLGTNYTFSAYATGGLETQMQAFFIAASTYITFLILKETKKDYRKITLLSFLCSCACLTRIDSVIPLFILFYFVLTDLKSGKKKYRFTAFIFLFAPVLLIVGTWLTWKYTYYGNLLPNTFYVKASGFSIDTLTEGAKYFYIFLNSYFLFPIVLLFIFSLKKFLSKIETRIIISIVIFWCLYILKVGGDFMEFRFLVPILPLVIILVLTAISPMDKEVMAVFITLMIIGSLHHSFTFKGYGSKIESIYSLNDHIINWKKTGTALGKLFYSDNSDVVIATTAAGAVPYYSRLKTIDMMGLNDSWIAKNGIKFSKRVGHTLAPPMEYLIKRGVNLVVGQPRFEPREAKSRKYSIDDLTERHAFFLYRTQKNLFPKNTKIIEIPLDNKIKLSVLYLIQNDYIDNVIEEKNLHTYKLKGMDN